MTDKKRLTLNDIIKNTSLREEEYEVKEWGGVVIIREMTGESRDAWEQSMFTENKKGHFERNLDNARAKLIAACVIGPDGKRMFKTDQHIKALGNMPASIIDKLYAKCQQINAISDQDIEEIAGN